MNHCCICVITCRSLEPQASNETITRIEIVLVQCKNEGETNKLLWTTQTMADGMVSNDINAIVIEAQVNKRFGPDAGVTKLPDGSK